MDQALALARAVLGPTVYDRVLSVNMFGTKTVLLISVIAYLAGRPDFLDLALAYALINFIGVLAVLEFFKAGSKRHKAKDEDLATPYDLPLDASITVTFVRGVVPLFVIV